MFGPALLGMLADFTSVQTALCANAAVLAAVMSFFALAVRLWASPNRQTMLSTAWPRPSCGVQHHACHVRSSLHLKTVSNALQARETRQPKPKVAVATA